MKTGESGQAPARPQWAWQHSLQHRILVAYGAVFVATVVLLLVWIGDAVYRADLDAGRHELEATAVLAANTLEEPLDDYAEDLEEYLDAAGRGSGDRSGGDDDDDDDDDAVSEAELLRTLQRVQPTLQETASDYAAGSLGRVIIADALGGVLADSLAPVTPPASQPVARLAGPPPAAVQSSEGLAARPGPPGGVAYSLIVTAPVQQDDQILGAVQISKPVDAVTADVRGVLLRLALASLLALAVAAALAVWIGRRLVQPLRELEAAAFAVAAGDFSQTVAVNRDDELGALARAFNHMVREVRSLLDQQRAFVANASHELRTPLTNIKLRSEALRTLRASDPQREARYLAEIEAEADRLTRLANDLLDLARLEKSAPGAAAAQIDRPAIDPAPILHKVAAMMQLRAEQAGLALCATVAGDLAHLRAHPEDLEVITANLLDNAIKYTQPGGAVQLVAANRAGGVEIRVQDNGPGIPAADRPHVFKRFYRVDKMRSRRTRSAAGAGSGAGLGLAIVQELVARNGGRVSVEPAPGQGTIFLVSFPPQA